MHIIIHNTVIIMSLYIIMLFYTYNLFAKEAVRPIWKRKPVIIDLLILNVVSFSWDVLLMREKIREGRAKKRAEATPRYRREFLAYTLIINRPRQYDTHDTPSEYLLPEAIMNSRHATPSRLKNNTREIISKW